MLESYPRLENWHHVRFSDETHFGASTEQRVWIWRRARERYYPDYIHVRTERPAIVKLHAWAAVGYNFKSELVFYTTDNNNGKMSNTVYIN